MKVVREMCLSIFIAFFLISSPTYAQSPAKESYEKGVEYAIQGKFNKAKEEFEKALKVDPFYLPGELSLEIIEDVLAQKIKTETATHLFKGDSNRKQGQTRRAIRDYTKAIEINPRFTYAYLERGTAYVIKSQYDRAIHDYTKAIEINPKFVAAYTNRGVTYNRKGQVDWAIRDYTKAIEINPKYARAYNNRGNAYRKKGQYDRAIHDYNKALKINPKYALAYNNRGRVYLGKLGNKVKGCADWKKGCELGKCRKYSRAKQRGDCP